MPIVQSKVRGGEIGPKAGAAGCRAGITWGKLRDAEGNTWKGMRGATAALKNRLMNKSVKSLAWRLFIWKGLT